MAIEHIVASLLISSHTILGQPAQKVQSDDIQIPIVASEFLRPEDIEAPKLKRSILYEIPHYRTAEKFSHTRTPDTKIYHRRLNRSQKSGISRHHSQINRYRLNKSHVF